MVLYLLFIGGTGRGSLARLRSLGSGFSLSKSQAAAALLFLLSLLQLLSLSTPFSSPPPSQTSHRAVVLHSIHSPSPTAAPPPPPPAPAASELATDRSPVATPTPRRLSLSLSLSALTGCNSLAKIHCPYGGICCLCGRIRPPPPYICRKPNAKSRAVGVPACLRLGFLAVTSLGLARSTLF